MLDRIIHLETPGAGTDDGGSGSEGEGEENQPTPPPATGTGEAEETVPKSELDKANADAAKRRRELREAQKRVEELEAKDKTEAERLQADRDKASQERDTAVSENRMLRARVLAPTAGIADAKAAADAATLLDWSKIEDPSDDSQVEQALVDLVKDRPYLAGNVAGGSDGGAGGSRGQGGAGMNQLIRDAAGK